MNDNKELKKKSTASLILGSYLTYTARNAVEDLHDWVVEMALYEAWVLFQDASLTQIFMLYN